MGQEINAVIQKCFIIIIDIAHRSKPEADHIRTTALEVFNGAGKQEFHRARSELFSTTHEVKPPTVTTINWHKSHKGMNSIGIINRQCAQLLLISPHVKVAHTETHLRTALVREPGARDHLHLEELLGIFYLPTVENDAQPILFCPFGT